MSDLDWSTPDGLAAIRDHLAARIDGWRQPVAYAVGLSPASSSPEWVFAHVNAPGGRHGLPGRRARHRARPRRSDRHAAAVAGRAGRGGGVARAGRGVHRPWSTRTSPPGARCSPSSTGNPAREAQAVFVADLDDPVTSEADGSMRATFEGHAPEL